MALNWEELTLPDPSSKKAISVALHSEGGTFRAPPFYISYSEFLLSNISVSLLNIFYFNLSFLICLDIVN